LKPQLKFNKPTPRPKFHKAQLVIVVDDGTGSVLEPDFITTVEGYSMEYGWSYYVRGCSYPLAECQIRRVRPSEIK
jgi:hypothetical protein